MCRDGIKPFKVYWHVRKRFHLTDEQAQVLLVVLKGEQEITKQVGTLKIIETLKGQNSNNRLQFEFERIEEDVLAVYENNFAENCDGKLIENIIKEVIEKTTQLVYGDYNYLDYNDYIDYTLARVIEDFIDIDEVE